MYSTYLPRRFVSRRASPSSGSSLASGDGGVQALGGGGGGPGGGYCAFYGGDHYTATRFEYASNGRAVTAIAGEQWCWDGVAGSPSNASYDVTFAREFRYDGSRQRYLDRELDPHWLKFGDYIVLSDTWSDYDGDNIYGDFTVSGPSAVNTRSYEPGVGKVDPWNATGSGATDYYHTDKLGTNRMMTDELGVKTEESVYTAFGERISGTSRRYGYVGAWGYQSHVEMPYKHVGNRYYDPSTGRFLLRKNQPCKSCRVRF